MTTGRHVSIRDHDGHVLGRYEIRSDGMTCVWQVRRITGYAANVSDAIAMIRRVAALLDRTEVEVHLV
jgi:hypothetical protein